MPTYRACRFFWMVDGVHYAPTFDPGPFISATADSHPLGFSGLQAQDSTIDYVAHASMDSFKVGVSGPGSSDIFFDDFVDAYPVPATGHFGSMGPVPHWNDYVPGNGVGVWHSSLLTQTGTIIDLNVPGDGYTPGNPSVNTGFDLGGAIPNLYLTARIKVISPAFNDNILEPNSSIFSFFGVDFVTLWIKYYTDGVLFWFSGYKCGFVHVPGGDLYNVGQFIPADLADGEWHTAGLRMQDLGDCPGVIPVVNPVMNNLIKLT